jgi:hypothetical protein
MALNAAVGVEKLLRWWTWSFPFLEEGYNATGVGYITQVDKKGDRCLHAHHRAAERGRQPQA